MTKTPKTRSPSAADLRSLAEQQLTALLTLLEAQQASRYGSVHGFATIRQSGDYAQLPLMTYDSVHGVADYWGERGNFTTDRIAAYFLTSGSSAAPKKIPVTSTLIRQKARAFAAFWERVYADHPALKDGKFIANFGDSGHSERNADNIPELSETTFWNQRMQGFQAKDRWPIPRQLTAIENAEHRYYAAARLALQGPLHCLMSLNPSTLVKFCEIIATHRDALAAGLDSGQWGLTALDTAALPEALSKRLVANSDAAERVRATTHDDWQLKDLWCELELIICWQSELVAPYLDLLRRHCDGVAFRDYITQSSECIMAIPVRDDESGGLLATEAHYFEFVPAAHQHEDQPATLTADQVVAGQYYELVVTTGGGLYRYRTGDCILINHFENGTPHLSFQYRFGRTSSITGEKLTEQHVLGALEHVDTPRVLKRRDVLVFPRTGDKPHYAVLIDENTLQPDCNDAALQTWINDLHIAIGNANGEYQDKCASLRLGLPCVLVTNSDGIAHLHRQFRAVHVGDDQYKPGVLRRERDLDHDITIVRQIRADR